MDMPSEEKADKEHESDGLPITNGRQSENNRHQPIPEKEDRPGEGKGEESPGKQRDKITRDGEYDCVPDRVIHV